MAVGIIFSVLAGILALAGAYVYFFGIDPELKRKLQKEALKTMGENQMSYMAKDGLNKIPASNQEDVKDLKKGISNLAGGALQNPLGDQAVRAATQVWDSAQNLSKSAIERVDWDTVQSYSKSALDRVSTMTTKSKEKVENTAEAMTDKTE